MIKSAKDTPDLFKEPMGLDNKRHIYTVSQITQDIKLILENTFGEVWIEGEVSNFKAHPSGHFYFSLKDKEAILKTAMFNWANKEVKFKIEDGLKVICFGRIDVYPPHGEYKLIIEKIEPKGIGSLQLALEQLKQKLEKEGLFSAQHKRPIPYLPSRIGIVTSLSGAAIKDILKVLDRRFSDVHIIIKPAQVQGEGAKQEIAQAIKDLNNYNESLPPPERIEVMIVGRGGGSIEDLWSFNEEIVARAIYNSKIPVISAVGHERDVTIADLVADIRAATPSVAAEIVVPKKEDLKDKLITLAEDLKRTGQEITLDWEDDLTDLAHRLNLAAAHTLELSAGDFNGTYRKLLLLNPMAMLERYQEKIIDFTRQLSLRIGHFLKLKQAEFSGIAEKLSSLSPLNILGRGYSITFKMPEGAIMKDAKLIKVGDTLKTKLHKGEILSQVTEV